MSQQLVSFFSSFTYFTDQEKELIEKTWGYIQKNNTTNFRLSGEEFIAHPLRVATILAELSMDGEAISASLLHSFFNTSGFSHTDLEATFGPQIAKLVQGISRISGMHFSNKTQQQAESIRKMFFAMVDDIRVIIIRLADRLDKMRGLKVLPANEQKLYAQDTIEIWAPLANRLGISLIKDELEDLSLKFLNREVFDQIKLLVSSKKSERADFLLKAEQDIVKKGKEAGIEVSVHSRAKHFWSIFQKMKKRNKAADELFDLLAMRILCASVNECYTMLGLVHTIWKPLDMRFKDYIAMPKSNGYQSLHTTVLTAQAQPLEIQIRTHEMHYIAENGIASHWIYKKGSKRQTIETGHLSLMNQLKELSSKTNTDEEYLSSIKSDLLGDSIFVFTPKGDIIELPSGSTAVDFAYYIHSAVGEKIVGAKADGSIIQLSNPLKNTQVVEVLTHPQAHPTVNQYNHVRTAKARQKIRAWLQENEPTSGFEKKIQEVDRKQVQESADVFSTLHIEQEQENVRDINRDVLKIRIGDTTNFLIKFANCCRPIPSEKITGYVSRGRGVIIHTSDCKNLLKIPEIASRNIPVEWESGPQSIRVPLKKTKQKRKKTKK